MAVGILVPFTFIILQYSHAARIKVPQQCQPLNISMCRGLGYNYTAFPTSLHATQDEARRELYKYYPLIKVGCSHVLREFLCSVYIPVCTPTGVLKPCRSLCRIARKGCFKILRDYGFLWPAHLMCKNLPKKSRQTLCIDNSWIIKARSTKALTTGHIAFDKTQAAVITSAYKQPACQKLRISMCQGLNYSMTIFPNFLRHRHQPEASKEVSMLWPLVSLGCSGYLQEFLCSVYAPRCFQVGSIPPCRSLCEKARDPCVPLMEKYDFHWPSDLNCTQYPVSGRSLCIDVPDASFIAPTIRPTAPATDKLGSPCGRTRLLMSPQGSIASPNYPDLYPKNCKCKWMIWLPTSYHLITFEIQRLFLEEDSKCYYDYIMFLDKLHNQVGPRYCGAHQRSFKVVVQGHVAVVLFNSDLNNPKSGFVITYTAQASARVDQS